MFYFEAKSSCFERVAKREDDEFSKRLQSPLVAADLGFGSPCIIADDVIASTGLGLHQIGERKETTKKSQTLGFMLRRGARGTEDVFRRLKLKRLIQNSLRAFSFHVILQFCPIFELIAGTKF